MEYPENPLKSKERLSKSYKSRLNLKINFMKNFLKLSFSICFIFVVTYTNAQIKFGPKAGLNLSTMTLKASGLSIDPKTMVGFNVGVILEITLKDNFILQPGVLFSTKGSKYSVLGSDMSISPSFLEIPINGLYKFDLGSAKLFLFAGPYFAFGVGGSYKTPDESKDISYGSGEDKDMKSFDFGLNFGAGIEISNFQISAQYGLGLTNLAPVTTNDAEMKVRVIGISMAYLLGGK